MCMCHNMSHIATYNESYDLFVAVKSAQTQILPLSIVCVCVCVCVHALCNVMIIVMIMILYVIYISTWNLSETADYEWHVYFTS